MPVWARDQRQLYYWANATRQLVAVDVVRTEPTFTVGTKVALTISAIFQTGLFNEANFDVMPDGTFIVITPTDNPSRGPNPQGTQAIHIVLNWVEELKQRMPAR